ncbi:hypothetical protein CHUAL_010259 [Chamberlinius hualienensis]
MTHKRTQFIPSAQGRLTNPFNDCPPTSAFTSTASPALCSSPLPPNDKDATTNSQTTTATLPPHVNILYWNIRGFWSNSQQLLQYKELFEAHIFCLAETWIDNTHSVLPRDSFLPTISCILYQHYVQATKDAPAEALFSEFINPST